MGITRRLERLESLLQEVNARHAGDGVSADVAAVEPVAADAPTTQAGDGQGLPEVLRERLPVRSRDMAGLEAATGVVESLGLGFHLGSAVERIVVAAGRGSDGVLPLREAMWLIHRYMTLIEHRPIGADLHASSAALARTSESIAGLKALADALAAGARDESSPPPEPAVAGPPEPPAAAAGPPAGSHPSFGRELALIIARWLVIVVSVIVVVLAVTLIADWL